MYSRRSNIFFKSLQIPLMRMIFDHPGQDLRGCPGYEKLVIYPLLNGLITSCTVYLAWDTIYHTWRVVILFCIRVFLVHLRHFPFYVFTRLYIKPKFGGQFLGSSGMVKRDINCLLASR